jgi:guanylate kinase
MRSNLSKKEIEAGRELIETLLKKNLRLLPHHLKELVLEYGNFFNHPKETHLWLSNKTNKKEFKQKYDKIVLLLSGITASGKDTIREEIERLFPNLLTKTITATSRKPRLGEIHGKDYYFFNNSKHFRESIKDRKFLEYIKRGDKFYGLPKKSLDDAIKQSNPVIYSQIEMSGWSKVEKYIKSITEINIFSLKIFVVPDMNFSEYKNWLTEKRSNDNLRSRLDKTGWELKKAPKKSHFIVTNKITKDGENLTYTAQTIINQTIKLLSLPKDK